MTHQNLRLGKCWKLVRDTLISQLNTEYVALKCFYGDLRVHVRKLVRLATQSKFLCKFNLRLLACAFGQDCRFEWFTRYKMRWKSSSYVIQQLQLKYSLFTEKICDQGWYGENCESKYYHPGSGVNKKCLHGEALHRSQNLCSYIYHCSRVKVILSNNLSLHSVFIILDLVSSWNT